MSVESESLLHEWQQFLVNSVLRQRDPHPTRTVYKPIQTSDMDCVTMGEPIMLNPNSYTRVKQVLDVIRANKYSEHTWSMVGCDGVSYVLSHRLRDDCPDLHDALLWPGQGHLEINFVKLLLKLLWPVGLETLAAMVDFQTARALHYAFEAGNHHKSWEKLHIYFQAIVQLQITDFTKTTLSPTAPEFFHWIHLQPNPTYRYVHHITFP